MNCDDFPALYESDDAAERRRAEDHAANCPHCRETLRIIGIVRDELSVATPPADPPPFVRPAPALVPTPVSTRRRDWLSVSAMAACLVIVAVLVFVELGHLRDRRRDVVRPESVNRGHRAAAFVRVEDDAPQQLGDLEAELALLSQQLDRIEFHAVLLEERTHLASLKTLAP